MWTFCECPQQTFVYNVISTFYIRSALVGPCTSNYKQFFVSTTSMHNIVWYAAKSFCILYVFVTFKARFLRTLCEGRNSAFTERSPRTFYKLSQRTFSYDVTRTFCVRTALVGPYTTFCNFVDYAYLMALPILPWCDINKNVTHCPKYRGNGVFYCFVTKFIAQYINLESANFLSMRSKKSGH